MPRARGNTSRALRLAPGSRGGSKMFRSLWIVLGLACVGMNGPFGPVRAWGDEFERIEGEALAGVPRNNESTAHEQLTVGEIDALPNVLRESRSALLLATTDRGN